MAVELTAKRVSTVFTKVFNNNLGLNIRLLCQQPPNRTFSRRLIPVSAFSKIQSHKPTRENATVIPTVVYPLRSCSHLSTSLQTTEPDKLYSLVEVECRGHEPAVLKSYLTFVSAAAGHLDIDLQEVVWPKKHIQRWTLLKSIHIYKKHRVQYEVRTYFLIMKFVKLTGSTADTFLEYLQRNLPEGIAMKVTKHELQKLPEHVKPSAEVVQ